MIGPLYPLRRLLYRAFGFLCFGLSLFVFARRPSMMTLIILGIGTAYLMWIGYVTYVQPRAERKPLSQRLHTKLPDEQSNAEIPKRIIVEKIDKNERPR